MGFSQKDLEIKIIKFLSSLYEFLIALHFFLVQSILFDCIPDIYVILHAFSTHQQILLGIKEPGSFLWSFKYDKFMDLSLQTLAFQPPFYHNPGYSPASCMQNLI